MSAEEHRHAPHKGYRRFSKIIREHEDRFIIWLVLFSIFVVLSTALTVVPFLRLGT